MKNYNYEVKNIYSLQYSITTKNLDYKDSLGPEIILTRKNDLNWHLKINSSPLPAIGVLAIVKLVFDIEELNITSLVLDVNTESNEITLHTIKFKKSENNKVEDYYQVLLNAIEISCR